MVGLRLGIGKPLGQASEGVGCFELLHAAAALLGRESMAQVGSDGLERVAAQLHRHEEREHERCRGQDRGEREALVVLRRAGDGLLGWLVGVRDGGTEGRRDGGFR